MLNMFHRLCSVCRLRFSRHPSPSTRAFWWQTSLQWGGIAILPSVWWKPQPVMQCSSDQELHTRITNQRELHTHLGRGL